jgi:hypothetical protein
LIASSALHLISSLGIALAVCPVLMAIFLSAHERGHVPSLIRLEFLVETHFIITGMITFSWYLF